MSSPRRRGSRTWNLELRTTYGRRSFAFAACAILAATLVSSPSPAQEAPALTESSEISVITILPGDPLYSAFGHTAIRVRDDSAGFDVGYNYGTFDFDDEGFYIKFLRGRLDYVLARDRFQDMLYAYQADSRPVIQQRLNLTLDERQELFDLLEINYLPENRAYRYEFLYDNCSTRPRDVIEAAWGHQMAGGTGPTTDTFRDLIDEYLEGKSWTRFGIDILLGSPTDVVASPRDRMFLPDEFLTGVDAARSPDGARLARPPDTLYWDPGYARWNRTPPWPAMTGWAVLIAIAGLSLFAGVNPRIRTLLRGFDVIYFSAVGFLGVVIALLWFATEHAVTKSNWNLIWALPTHLVLAFALLRENRGNWLVPYLWLTIGSIAITVLGWSWMPQGISPWIAPYLGLGLIRAAFNIRDFRAVNERVE